MKSYLSCLVVATLAPLAAIAQETPDQAKDEAQIRKTGKAYVDAFNAGDAKTLAEFWSPEAVYTNRQTGEQVVGRKAIAKQFTELFKSAKGLKLEVDVESIQFVSPNVAVEAGVASFVAAKADPELINYSAVYVRRDGKWLLDRVTDDPSPAAPSSYQQLKQLEWMVGTWVDEDESARIETECKWAKNNSFITRSFSVAIEGRIDMSGMQVIGWDAAEKQIRSWTFDSDGGFSEGKWTSKGKQWLIRKVGVLADGRKASAVNVVTKIDDNMFTLKSVARAVGGDILPSIDEVTVVRSGTE
jgi:uncharacterized protein (TIGR02246 family)